MEINDAAFVAEFVVESQEGLANIEQQMLAIESGGADMDLELVNAVFRTMHTIKGTAGFFGLERIGSLAHGLEEVLNGMRNREIATSSELVTTILKAADFMKGLIDSIETSDVADISEHVAALQRYKPGAAPEAAPANSKEPAAATAAEPARDVFHSDAVREFLVECHENLDRMDQELLAWEENSSTEPSLRGIFRTVHAVKEGAGFLGLSSLEKLAVAAEALLTNLRNGRGQPPAADGAALLAMVEKCREGLRLVETQGNDAGFDPEPTVRMLQNACREQFKIGAPTDESPRLPMGELLVNHGQARPQAVEAALAAQAAGDPRHVGEILVQDGAARNEDVVAALRTQQDAKGPSASDGNIRVDVGLLDKLMTRVGELVLARNQIVQYTSRFEDASFISTAQRLNLITTELQESVMKTRMQPIGNVWAKFPRVVRDLASQLGKQVRIDMEGKETELDKTIVESIKDPLTHLVRNSVDHGVETPDVRRAAGKPAEGVLLLRAYHEGGQVNIEITDDGAGLNLERIRKKAAERGLMSPDQAARMSDRDVAQLIFAPGFSTAEKVTSVSGRGVGMDVVKTNIERIGGTIDLQTRPGRGTTVKIKIPLTLAIIPALVVTNDGDRYAIPQVSLLELVRLDGAEVKRSIEYVHGAPVYRLRGKLLPLVNLSERLGLATQGEGEPRADIEDVVNIVVLRTNDRQFGLVVDKINDTEEIVVKPLSRQLKGLSEFAGATIMGDGTIALILDVMGLAVAAGLAGEMREQNHAAALKSDSQAGRKLETLLVVDLGDSRRFALPTSMISRLEKVAASAIEYADGREVIQYRGAIMPLTRLSEVFGASCHDEAQEEFQIVVYADQDYRCGLVVNRIVDIVETELQFSATRSADDDLLGTSVIQQRVTDVLNLRRLARRPATPKYLSNGSRA